MIGPERLHRILRTKSAYLREFLSELLGTLVLVTIGCGAAARQKLSTEKSVDFVSVNISWALAAVVAIYATGGDSGAHLNPAISLALCVYGKLQWRKLPIYLVAQNFGAFLGSCLVFGAYYDGISELHQQNQGASNPVSIGSVGIFATYPSDNLRTHTALCYHILGSAILTLTVIAITDSRNNGVPKHAIPWAIGSCVAVLGMTFDYNAGYAFNPARDLGPRVFAMAAGWGHEPFSIRNSNWFWIPIVGPYIGAVVGALLYFLTVGNHQPKRSETDGNDEAQVLMGHHNLRWPPANDRLQILHWKN